MQKHSSNPTSPSRQQNAIRVLHVTDVEAPNYYLNNLVDYSADLGIEYHVVTLLQDRGFLTDLKSRGVRICELRLGSRRLYPLSYFSVLRLIRKWKVQVVHTHLFFPSLFGLLAAKTLGRKTVMTRHHSDAVFRISGRLKHKIYLWLELLSNRLSDHIIAPSTMVESVLRERESVPADKISLIPYGQDVKRFQAVSKADIEKVVAELDMHRTLAIVCVCRLFREKGHRFLFTALSQLKQEGRSFHLYLAGVGGDREAIEHQCREAGLAEQTTFLGWRDDVLRIVAAADIFVHPSLHEALPSAVIEAMLLERPIVATDVSGVRDIVNRYGQIIPPADSVALANSVRWTMDNMEAARQLSREGRARLLKTMDARKVAEAYAEVYLSIMS